MDEQINRKNQTIVYFLGYVITGRRICSSPVFYQMSNVGFRINQYLTHML